MQEKNESRPALDRSALLARCGGNEQLLMELVEMFQEDTPQGLAEIHDAIQRRNAEQVRFRTHHLCSAISSFGKSPAFDAARKLEMLAQTGDLTHAEDSYAFLERTLWQLGNALAELSPAASMQPAAQR